MFDTKLRGCNNEHDTQVRNVQCNKYTINRLCSSNIRRCEPSCDSDRTYVFSIILKSGYQKRGTQVFLKHFYRSVSLNVESHLRVHIRLTTCT